MKAIKVKDPRREKYKAQLLKLGNGTRLSAMKEDATHVYADILYRAPVLGGIGQHLGMGWYLRGNFKVKK